MAATPVQGSLLLALVLPHQPYFDKIDSRVEVMSIPLLHLLGPLNVSIPALPNVVDAICGENRLGGIEEEESISVALFDPRNTPFRLYCPRGSSAASIAHLDLLLGTVTH